VSQCHLRSPRSSEPRIGCWEGGRPREAVTYPGTVEDTGGEDEESVEFELVESTCRLGFDYIAGFSWGVFLEINVQQVDLTEEMEPFPQTAS